MNLASDTYNGLIRDTRAVPVQSPLLPFFVLTCPFFVYSGCLSGHSKDLTPSTSSHLHSILGFHKMILLDLPTEDQIPISWHNLFYCNLDSSKHDIFNQTSDLLI